MNLSKYTFVEKFERGEDIYLHKKGGSPLHVAITTEQSYLLEPDIVVVSTKSTVNDIKILLEERVQGTFGPGYISYYHRLD